MPLTYYGAKGVLSPQYTVPCTLYSVHNTQYSIHTETVQCTLYSILVYTVQRTHYALTYTIKYFLDILILDLISRRTVLCTQSKISAHVQDSQAANVCIVYFSVPC